MKPASHQYEDKLLEFAYGELPAHEASAIDAHVKTCARCTAALDEIRSVRSAMSALPQVSVSDKGLDSLLAYAEQAAKRNAEAAAPVPFFARFRKWVAPLAGATAVLLVGGLYWKASQNVDLTRESAAKEVVAEKKAADFKAAAPTAAPAPEKVAQAEAAPEGQAADKPAELAEKNVNELEKRKEGGDEEFDRLVDTKQPSKLKKAPAKPVAVQRDGFKELPANDSLAAAKPVAPAPLDSRGKGGGGRREADVANYYDAKTTGTGSAPGGLSTEVAKADSIERKQSVSKRAAVNKDLANGDDDGAKQVLDNSEGPGFMAKTAPATKSGKKAKSKLEADNTAGGGEIARADTGSYSSGIAAGDKADKKAEEKKEKRPEPPPAAANAPNQWTPEQYVAQQKQQASPYGLSGGSASSASQQAAQPPPPPPAQVAANSAPAPSSTRPSMQLGPRQSKGSTISDESLEVQGELQTPAMKSNTQDIAATKRARQMQLADAMRQAKAADDAGDLKKSMSLYQDVLQNDAEGPLRAESLYRMCVGFQRLGLEDKAQPYCDELQAEFPSSSWAAKLRSEQNERRASPPKASKSKAYQQDQNYESPAPAREQKAAPAETMHAF